MRCEIHGKEMIPIGSRDRCPECLAEKSEPARIKHDAFETHRAVEAFKVRLGASGVPPLYFSQNFKSFVPPNEYAGKVARALCSYCTHFDDQRDSRSGFAFLGRPGTGKTHLACSMVKSLIETGHRAIYVTMPALTLQMRSLYRNAADDAGSIASIVDSYVSCDLLIIDEIDLHGSSATDYQVLYEIVNGRYAKSGHPTVIISNRTYAELRNDLDDRILSRLLGGNAPIAFEWDGHRASSMTARR